MSESHSLIDLDFDLSAIATNHTPIPQIYNLSATGIGLLENVDVEAELNTWFSPTYPAITTLVLHLGVLPRILALPLLWINQQTIPNVCSITNLTSWEKYPCEPNSVSLFLPDPPKIAGDLPETWKDLSSIKGEIQDLEKTICENGEKILDEILSSKLEDPLKDLVSAIEKIAGDDEAEVRNIQNINVLQMIDLLHRLLNVVGEMDITKVLSGITTSEGTTLMDVIKDSVGFDITLRDGSAVLGMLENVMEQLHDEQCGEIFPNMKQYARFFVNEAVDHVNPVVEALLLLDIDEYPFSLVSCGNMEGTVKFLLEETVEVAIKNLETVHTWHLTWLFSLIDTSKIVNFETEVKALCGSKKATPFIKEICDPEKIGEKAMKNKFISEVFIESDDDSDEEKSDSRKKRSILDGIVSPALEEHIDEGYVSSVVEEHKEVWDIPSFSVFLTNLKKLKANLVKLNPRELIEKIITQFDSIISCVYDEFTQLITGLRSVHVEQLMKGDGPWNQIDEYVKNSAMLKNATSVQALLKYLDNRLPEDISELEKFVPENLRKMIMAEYAVGWDLSEALIDAAPEWRTHLGTVRSALHKSKNAQELCLAMTSILKNPSPGTGKLESSLEWLCKLDTGFFENLEKQLESYYGDEFDKAVNAWNDADSETFSSKEVYIRAISLVERVRIFVVQHGPKVINRIQKYMPTQMKVAVRALNTALHFLDTINFGVEKTPDGLAVPEDIIGSSGVLLRIVVNDVSEADVKKYADPNTAEHKNLKDKIAALKKYLSSDSQKSKMSPNELKFVRINRIDETTVRADFIAPCDDSFDPFRMKKEMDSKDQMPDVKASDVTVKKVPMPKKNRVTRATLTISGQDFKEDFKNQSSAAFIEFKQDFESKMLTAMKEKDERVIQVLLLELRKGSLIADSSVITNDTTSPEEIKDVLVEVKEDNSTEIQFEDPVTEEETFIASGQESVEPEADETDTSEEPESEEENGDNEDLTEGTVDGFEGPDVVKEPYEPSWKSMYFLHVTVPAFAAMMFIIILMLCCCRGSSSSGKNKEVAA